MNDDERMQRIAEKVRQIQLWNIRMHAQGMITMSVLPGYYPIAISANAMVQWQPYTDTLGHLWN